MSVRLAVFDCDGTLVDGQAAVCGAMATAFADCGLVAPPSHLVRRIVGLSLPVAIRNLAPGEAPQTHDQVVAAYKQAFFRARTEGRVAEPLYDEFAARLEGELGQPVGRGVFGADMQVELVNDGPVTVIIDSRLRE